MKKQPNRNYRSNDVVMTPQTLADALVEAIDPCGLVLEPCVGSGAFVSALRRHMQTCDGINEVETCEISDGRDFLQWRDEVDWVLTNPPWSQFRAFLAHALTLAHDVALLSTVNHWWTRHRVQAVQRAGFGYRHLVLCDWPDEFPASGFQLGMMHVSKGYEGPLQIHWLPGHGQHAVRGPWLEFRGVA